MPTQTTLAADDIAVGVLVILSPGLVGTMTGRRTVDGDRIVAAHDASGAWVPVSGDMPLAIDPASVAADGSPAWGEDDGCPLGTPEMGCDMVPGCVGECCPSLDLDGDVRVDLYAPDPDPLALPVYSGPVAGAAALVAPGIYSAMTMTGTPGITNWTAVFVQITETGQVSAHLRG